MENPYNVQSLREAYHGVVDGPFASAAIAKNSLLGHHLYALYDYDDLSAFPRFTARQYLAAILLGFRKRTATKKQIMEAMLSWPAVSAWIEDYDPETVLGLSEGELKCNSFESIASAKAFRSVAALLVREEDELYGDFPPPEVLPPVDPVARAHWEQELRRETAEEEDDPQDELRYDYLYGNQYQQADEVSWFEEFGDELANHQKGCGSDKRNYTLPPNKENCIFASYMDGWVAEGARKFHGWSRLPSELKLMIIEYAFVFDQPIVVTVRRYIRNHMPTNHAEELTNIRFCFDVAIRAPLAIVPKSSHTRHVSIGRTSDLICGRGKVCKATANSDDFQSIFEDVFYSKNTFELHDSNKPREFGTHRWLELMSKRGYLSRVRNLNINICLGELGQSRWHLRRTTWAILSMPKLKRLVVDVDMRSLVRDPEDEYNVDIHFEYSNVTNLPRYWPMFRMLAWSELDFGIFIPQFREMETWTKALRVLTKGDHQKFWVREDWCELSKDSVSEEIRAAISKIKSRQLDAQEISRNYFIDEADGEELEGN
jgi:hypothetical protein